MTESPVRLSRGFTYVTGKSKKITARLKKVTDLSRGKSP